MNDRVFEVLVEKIQNEVFTETKNALGEKGFKRWRTPKYNGVMGMTFEAVLDMKDEDVLQEIGTFPEEEKHCATLAVQALQEALNTYLVSVHKW